MSVEQTPTLNPYSALGALLGPGLDAIVAAAPVTIDDLVAAVETYIETTFYSGASTQVQIEISSIAYHAINSYRNNLVLTGEAMYNRAQAPFIQMLIGNNAGTIQPDTIIAWLADVNDNVGTSDLTINDQVPLFLAITLGGNAVNYWAAQLAAGTPTWASYLSGNDYEDYINSLLWDVAAMNGALAGYGATAMGLIEPTTNKVSTNMISALIGALTVTAGKVMFNWIPRIVKPLHSAFKNMAAMNPPIITSGNHQAAEVYHNQVWRTSGGTGTGDVTIDGGWATYHQLDLNESPTHVSSSYLSA